MKDQANIPRSLETNYNGIVYRSRLEARWAVFFDAMNVRVAYEPEGYKLQSGCYLPDFLIRKQPRFPEPLWIEVKGVPTKLDYDLLGELVMHTGISGTMLFDVPDPYNTSDWSHGQDEIVRYTKDNFDGETSLGWDSGYLFCQCLYCGAVGFEYSGRAERIACSCAKGHKDYNSTSDELLNAYALARAARFEYD